MDWKSLGQGLAKLGLGLVGGALAGPAGATVGVALASRLGTNPDPEAVAKAIESGGPQAIQTVQSFEADNRLELEKINMEYAKTVVIQVNETMRAESRSEHWPQYSWRPWVGAWWPIAVMGVYVVLPIMGKPVPEVPYWIWAGWASILGVAAWHRGMTQRQVAGAAGNAAGSPLGGLLGTLLKGR